MKILIVGARGMLGTDIANALRNRYTLWEMDIDNLDICDSKIVKDVIQQIKPDIVINCAAFTNVDACEACPEKAFAVNADGVKNLALACKKNNSILYHISTDFVFDGKKKEPYCEADTTNPLSVYGKSKLAGEQFVAKILTRYVIIRTSWLFGKYGSNFIKTILKLSEQQDTLHIVNDQTGSPTYTVDLATAIRKFIIIPQLTGIYHICNSGQCTWYELAVSILESSGSKTKVVPISTHELGRPAARPAYSAMDCNKFVSATGMLMRNWENALAAYFAN